MLAGTSLGMIEYFFIYRKYIPFRLYRFIDEPFDGVLFEMILERKDLLPKQFLLIIVLTGTAFATNLIQQCNGLARYRFRTYGNIFTTTMFTANRVATNISSAQRSLYMLLAVL
jgi:hypothetical protein